MRGAANLAVAILGTALVAWWFALHPMPLRVGVTVQAELVPWWYQACAFPPFFLLVGGLVLQREDPWPRVALLGGASAVAVVRLLGFIPLSGHATFLSACLVFAAMTRQVPQRILLLISALLGLGVTTFSKLRWGDGFYFACSVGAGVALALLSRFSARRRA
jgi:hypothetical protein